MRWNFWYRQKMNCNTMSKAAVGLLVMMLFLARSQAAEAKEPENYFLVMEKVYAFTDPTELAEQIETLLEEGHEVVLGIMPVYRHTEYPAMLEFAEVIRYAQAKGCRILLHFPIVQKYDVSVDEVRSLLEGQFAMYEKMDIVPAGVLMGTDDAEYAWMEAELEQTFQIVRLDEPTLEFYVDTLGESFPVLYTEKLPFHTQSYEARQIPEEFDFKRGLSEEISVSLEDENRVLMVIVCIGIVIFSVMIVYARRRNQRDFLTKEKEDKDEHS